MGETVKRKGFVSPMEVEGGHVGKRVRHTVAPSGLVRPREPVIQLVDLSGEHYTFEVFAGLDLQFAPGQTIGRQAKASKVTDLPVQLVQWQEGGVTSRARYAWDGERFTLYLDVKHPPPEWFQAEMWKRLVAVEEGVIDKWNDIPIRPPRKPRRDPLTGAASALGQAAAAAAAGNVGQLGRQAGGLDFEGLAKLMNEHGQNVSALEVENAVDNLASGANVSRDEAARTLVDVIVNGAPVAATMRGDGRIELMQTSTGAEPRQHFFRRR